MFWNALVLAIREIRRNLLRSALTMLGIIIGVASVITMVNLGHGATAQISQEIASLGTNLLFVRPGQYLGAGQRIPAPAFDRQDADAIEREIPSVAVASPSSSTAVVAVSGNRNWATSVIGTDNRYLAVRNWSLALGRPFTDSELRAGRAVCILGATVQRELFGNQDPLGAKVRMDKISCDVIGVLESKGESTGGRDQDDFVIIPLSAFWRRVAGNTDVTSLQVSAREGVSTDKVRKDIERLMRERRRIPSNKDDDFNVRDMKEITETLTGTTRVLTSLLGAVAAVSLLVGGIGIMNIMLVSVTERTREIGIRLALGARAHDVLLQFLVEAVTLASLGGVLGVIASIGSSLWLCSIMKVPFVFDGQIISVAFLFSAAVGIVFGFFPARRAALLNPIDALRHE